jgi:rare lipoprotein A
VRVNDRGPFLKGRIIDLSYAAGNAIGLIGPGVVAVRVVALSKEVGKIRSGDTYKTLVEAKDLHRGKFTIQVGAFENKENARHLKERLSVIFDNVTVTTYMRYDDTTFYRVRVSLTDDLTKAGRIVERLEYLGFSDVFIVAL